MHEPIGLRGGERWLKQAAAWQGSLLVTGASRASVRQSQLSWRTWGADIAGLPEPLLPRSDIAGTIVQTVSDLEARGPPPISIQADLLDPADVSRMVEQTLGRFGGVDILANNAAFHRRSRFSRASGDVRRIGGVSSST